MPDGGSGGRNVSLNEEVEILRNIPMFANIESSKLKLLAFTSERHAYNEGEYLFRQGDEGDSAYIIVDGEADVIIETDGGPLTVAHFRKPEARPAAPRQERARERADRRNRDVGLMDDHRVPRRHHDNRLMAEAERPETAGRQPGFRRWHPPQVTVAGPQAAHAGPDRFRRDTVDPGTGQQALAVDDTAVEIKPPEQGKVAPGHAEHCRPMSRYLRRSDIRNVRRREIRHSCRFCEAGHERGSDRQSRAPLEDRGQGVIVPIVVGPFRSRLVFADAEAARPLFALPLLGGAR